MIGYSLKNKEQQKCRQDQDIGEKLHFLDKCNIFSSLLAIRTMR